MKIDQLYWISRKLICDEMKAVKKLEIGMEDAGWS
jgi:hypothetical protein